MSSVDLSIFEPNIKALVFDCDGTLINSMPTHFIAWTHVANKFGFSFPEKQFYEYGGKTATEIIKLLQQQQNIDYLPVPQILKEKETFFQKLEEEGHLEGIPETLDYLNYVLENRPDIKVAVCSGGERKSVMRSLSVLNLDPSIFGTIVTSENYEHGKPAPDAYLTTAKLLGVAPEDCVGFEDTDTGIQSITSAGYARAIDIRRLISKRQE